MYKKILVFMTLVTITMLCAVSAYAETIIYENKTSEIVSQGVKRENVKRFTSSGWLNINILRISLDDPYIDVDTIISKEGSSVRNTILQMANDSSAISAVNGDFYSPQPGTSKYSHSMSPVVKSGQLITTYIEEESKNKFGVFSLTKRDLTLLSYWSKNLSITAPNGKTMSIFALNKFGWYESLFMYDPSWGAKTPGKSQYFPNLVQMVVVNNVVQKIEIGSGPIDIPKNGYVICGDYAAGQFIKDNFKVGDTAKTSLRTTPTWSGLKMAIGGGAILVKNGVVPTTFSHDKPGSNPQTVVATTKDNKQMLLITVDGRQVISKGMTQSELANLCLSLGAFNALNLDGGGSTTMVSRDLGEKTLEVVNKISDPSPRSVINGIGVFSTAPKGTLKGLVIQNPDVNVFVNSSRKYSVLAYDTYNNPIDVDSSKLKWSFEGVSGKFDGAYFIPTSIGKGKIIAQIDGVKASSDINVLSSPVEIEVYPQVFSISPYPQWFGIRGYDKDGFMAFIYSRDVTISSTAFGTVTDNFILAKNSGLAKVTFGDVNAYFAVKSQNKVLNNFESDNDSFWGYPSTVGGSYTISDKYYKEGLYSGKLSFDFTNETGTRGAYIKFDDEGYSITSNPLKLSLWAYTPQKYSHGIKAEFTDSTGNVFRTTFAATIDWTGWKSLSTTIPEGTSYPIKLKKIYVVATDPSIKDTGEIYFDNLQLIYNLLSTNRLPASKKIKDYQNTATALTGSAYRVAFYGSSTSFESMALNNINSASYAGFVGTFPKESVQSVTTPYVWSNDGFKITDYKNSKFITVSAKGSSNDSSIRKRDANQWIKLMDALKTNTKDNIFILIDCPLTGNTGFCDTYELQLLKDTLGKYVADSKKNVWVIYNDKTSVSRNENGVKYLSVPDGTARQYLNVIINGVNVTYTYNRFY